ncbi:MAG TPA: hypothetical protein VJH75_00300 [Patescibacteria group bacterium]|nr:hypothetical protein [Patescibacteria group bacterium]
MEKFFQKINVAFKSSGDYLEKWQTKRPAMFYLSVFVIAFVIIVLRRVDVVAYAQFWAEDGTVWYEDAYNIGVSSIFIPQSGYLQTFSRLVGIGSQILPLVYAPLFFNIIAIIIKIIPILFIFSKRYRKNFPSILVPVILSLVYLSLPNTSEVYANVTNAHWYLATTAFLVFTAERATSRAGKIFDVALLILSGLSGPFIIFLFPVAVIWWWLNRKEGVPWLHLISMFVPFVLQVGSVLLTGSSRVPMSLGASLALFIKMTSSQVFLGALVGKEGYAELYNSLLFTGDYKAAFIYLVIFLIGSGIILWALFTGSTRLKLFLFFVGLVYITAIIKPMASATTPQWQVMALPGSTIRYWFLPMLGFLLAILQLFNRKSPLVMKCLGICLLLIMLYGMKFEWVYKAWPNLAFSRQVKQFEEVASGTKYIFKIMPENWATMKLIKH